MHIGGGHLGGGEPIVKPTWKGRFFFTEKGGSFEGRNETEMA